MEEILQDFRNLPITRREEKAFLELFEAALGQINQDLLSDQDISDGIQSAIDSFRAGPSNACAIEKFKTLADLCGYFYYFSPLSAGVARDRTMVALSDCDEFRSCFDRPLLRLVSLGGGTGSDLVGFFSAVFQGNFDFRDMEVQLIDNNRRFNLFFRVVEGLLRGRDFGNASLFFKSKRIRTSFICADLTKQISQCAEALENAHIVWMKGFISILKYDSERYRATESIKSYMPVGAFLVVMDSPSYFQYIQLDDLELLFSTNFGPYSFMLPFEPEFNISRQSNQEIRIYKKIG